MRNPSIEFDESLVRDGDILTTTREIRLDYTVQWQAPYSDGGSAIIPADTKLVARAPVRGAAATYAIPVDYERIGARAIPESVRQHPKFSGYAFFVLLEDIGTLFTLERP